MDKTAVTMINLSSLAGGASSTGTDCTALDLSRTIALFFELEATFDASATDGLSVKWYCSYDGTNWDTAEWLTDSVAVSAGNSVRVPLNPINPSAMYLRAIIQNNDSTYAVTNLKLIATQMDL